MTDVHSKWDSWKRDVIEYILEFSEFVQFKDKETFLQGKPVQTI